MQHGIGAAVYYPIPLHRQEVFAEAYKDVSLPVAEDLSQRVLSLPMFPELKNEQAEMICSIIRTCYQEG